MEILRINNIPVPIAVDTPDKDFDKISDIEQSLMNNLIGYKRDDKLGISFDTTHLTKDESYFWECLIEGFGHQFNLEEALYSSKGLPPYKDYDIESVSEGQKITELEYPINWELEYTLIFRKGDNDLYTINSQGEQFINEEKTSWDTNFFNFTGSILSLSDEVVLKEFQFLPYIVPRKYLKYFSKYDRSFSDLPRLKCEGLLIDKTDSYLEMFGESSSEYALFYKKGIQKGGRILTVNLIEK